MPRKKPFSVKKKKVQLQEKRAKKREELELQSIATASAQNLEANVHNIVQATSPSKILPPPRPKKETKLVSMFEKLTPEEIRVNKELSMQPLHRLPSTALEVQENSIFMKGLDIPMRPDWSYEMTKEQVETQELRYFRSWIQKIESVEQGNKVSLFEKNIEVWRQLWRVLEISDMFLLVVDIRHPLLYLPPTLYEYVTQTLKKPLIVVLNKVDLVSKNTAYAWTKYLEAEYPDMSVVPFSCYKNEKQPLDDYNLADLKKVKRRPKKRVFNNEDSIELLKIIKKLAPTKENVPVQWESIFETFQAHEDHSKPQDLLYNLNELAIKHQPAKVKNSKDSSDSNSDSGSDSGSDSDSDSGSDTNPSIKQPKDQIPTDEDNEKSEDCWEEFGVSKDYVTIGFIGSPNVGKSTIINSIMGKTVVSASRTPGHTKHFQTIHLSKTLRLCDCPGIVFPCYVERPLQVLMGLYNIAQVQEPYTSIKFLAERVPVEKILSLKHPQDDSRDTWSAWDIVEAFAIDLGYYTSRAARPDVYRAGIYILKLVLDGRILLSMKPPQFYSNENVYIKMRIDDANQGKVNPIYQRRSLREDVSSGGGHDNTEPFNPSGNGSNSNRSTYAGFALLDSDVEA